jgi:cation-transporting ATPase E
MKEVMAAIEGLSEAEVISRRQRGQGNNVRLATSRSYRDILQQNVLTFINVILFVIGAVLISVGRVGDAVVSVGLILMNIVIGVYQEARAKQQLDKIALLTRPKATAIREGQEKVIDPSEIVVGDSLVVRSGDQIVVDGVVVGDGKMDVDESLLTGESDLIPKKSGDTVMSGSFCVSGSAMYEAQKVGAESFANQLTASARSYRVMKTPLQRDIDLVIRLLTLLAMFIGFLLLVSAFLYAVPLVRGVQMASVIAGLVPNGLFFMVIVAYAMGALRIASRGALIQQSNSVESLSNVNVLCMDKTGTLTANRIVFKEAHPIGIDESQFKRILGDYAASVTASNRTSEALETALPGSAQKLIDEVPFSSALKWSAIACDSDALRGVYVLGALEMMQPYLRPGVDLGEQVRQYSDEGLRVLVFAHKPELTTLHDSQSQPRLPQDLTALGLISFTDELRPDALQTLSGFAKTGIRLKIISGDNPSTVAALAKQAGLEGDLRVISGTELSGMNDAEFTQAAEETTIFGRITPQQKEKLVDTLCQRGHYVAMIGDGVNDVLSLKKANLGIAMQSGSAATRGVADMILLNDSFSALPPAFLEGQRIVNGMSDILRLFLTRALMVAFLIVSCAVVGVGFPYVPKHVSLLTLLTVGLPTLALATWARPGVKKRGLLRSVIHFVMPASLTVFAFALVVFVAIFTLASNDLSQVEFTPEQVATYTQSLGLGAATLAPDELKSEVAGMIARSALTTFTVLTGILLVVFVEPPTAFFTGGDELSGDQRPTILALVMVIAFVLILLIAPLRSFFELLVLPLNFYVIIVASVLLWMLTVRQVWRRRLFDRFLNIDLSPA